MTTLNPSRLEEARRAATPSLPSYVSGVLIVCILAGFALAWSSRPTSDPASLVGQADSVLVDALRADDTELFAEAHGLYTQVLDRQPSNTDALRGAAIADLGLHRFHLALERATDATNSQPDDHVALAALVDANIELGRYEQAEIELNRLLALRPGIESASRLSYLRQLTGDIEGARLAMAQARAAASGLTFETARLDALIGELEFSVGNDDAAAGAYQRALDADPERLDAAVGLAAVAFRRGEVSAALDMIDGVLETEPGETAALILQAEVAASIGDDALAQAAANAVARDALAEHEAGYGIDPSAALPASSWGDPELGLQVARLMFDARPDNTRVAHAYAWALFRTGDIDRAAAPMLVATQFGADDLVLADHASEVLGAR